MLVGSLSAVIITTIVFVILKLCKVIFWNWLWVFSPLIIFSLICIFISIIMLTITIVDVVRERIVLLNEKKKEKREEKAFEKLKSKNIEKLTNKDLEAVYDCQVELGCPISVIMRALKNGIYVLNGSKHAVFRRVQLCKKRYRNTFQFELCNEYERSINWLVELYKYGSEWFLTEEEAEKVINNDK